MFKRLGTGTVVIVAALVLGFITGVLGTSLALPKTATTGVASAYPKNKNGQTYGSDFNARTPAEAPDLIAAVGVDGTEGYVRNEDLNEAPPKTPEEALARQAQREKDEEKGKFREIPLYANDGTTVIGTFRFAGHGKGK